MRKIQCTLYNYCLVIIGLLFLAHGVGAAETRVALVIGNSNYSSTVSLPNPTNDADDIAQALSSIGFQVSKVVNLNYDKMRRELAQFSSKAAKADIALVYYAGHGIEVNSQNYLVPTDAKLVSDRDVEFEAIKLDLVMRAASGARELSLVLLDACRNNPFAASMKRTIGTRSIGRGFSRIEPTSGTLVSYAAKEGTIAKDGDGRNSPYTSALMKHLLEPGLEIQFIFRRVRDTVLRETQGNQEPFVYGSLPGKEIYLIKQESQFEANTAEQSSDLVKKKPNVNIENIYNQVKDSKNVKILEIFSEQFPNSIYSKFAKVKIKELQQLNLSLNSLPSNKLSNKNGKKEQKQASLVPKSLPNSRISNKLEKVDQPTPAIVFDLGGKFDKSFNQSAFDGAEQFTKETGIKYRSFEIQNSSQREQAFRRFARAGNNPVIGIGFGHAQALSKVAKEYPETKFAIIDMVVDLPNVRSIVFDEHEGSYLVGVLAAKASKTGKVGFIGGMDISLIRKFACGFVQGVKSVNPNAIVYQNMTGKTGAAWNDPVKGARLTKSQIERGADIIYAVAGATSLGVMQAAADAGKFSIGVDSNQNYLHPGSVLTSMLKRVDVAVYNAFMDVKNDKWTTGFNVLGLKEGGVGYAIDNNNMKLISNDMKAAVSKAEADIKSGALRVHDYFSDNNCPVK